MSERRSQAMGRMWDSGMTLVQIGKRFGVSRQRVQQVIGRRPRRSTTDSDLPLASRAAFERWRNAQDSDKDIEGHAMAGDWKAARKAASNLAEREAAWQAVSEVMGRWRWEVNAAIHRHVFGWKAGLPGSGPDYMTSEKEAVEVVDRLVRKGYEVAIVVIPSGRGGVEYAVEMTGLGATEGRAAGTFESAICLAALRVLGVEPPE